MIHPFPRVRVPAAGVPVRAAVAGVAVAASLLIAGCAGGARLAAPPRVEKPDLTVAAVPAVDSAALYIAQQRGLFAAQGLHVKIVPVVSSSAAIAGQLAGRYDVTAGDYVSDILANALHHGDMRILAAAARLRPDSQEVVVPAGSPIQAIAALKGKSIGVNAAGNAGTLLVSSALADAGISPSDVHFVPIPFPEMAAALQAHRVDAAYLPEPYLTGAEMAIGAQPIVDTDQGTAENFPVSGFVVTQAWEHRYPGTAAAFRRAIRAAQAIAGSSLAAVQQAMVSVAGVPRVTAALMAPPGYPMNPDPAALQRLADLMLRFGMLPATYRVTPMLR
jgi:NitT/TauT family transport system substrate-binding protein